MAGPKRKTDTAPAVPEQTTPVSTTAAGVVASNADAQPATTPEAPAVATPAPDPRDAEIASLRANLASAEAEFRAMRESYENDLRALHDGYEEKLREQERRMTEHLAAIARGHRFDDAPEAVPAEAPKHLLSVGKVVLVIGGERVKLDHNQPIPPGADVSSLPRESYREAP